MIHALQPPTLPHACEWAAIQTKARCEKAVAAYLGSRHIPVYLPLVANRRVYGHRVRISHVPLFAGYVFFDPSVIENKEIFGCRKVACILRPSDPAELMRDLEAISRVLAVDDRVREILKHPPGESVEVIGGPLTGVAGQLIRVDAGAKLVIKVHFLGAAAELVIDEAFVRAV